MSAYSTVPNQPPVTAGDHEIRNLVEAMANTYGRAFIPSHAIYSEELREYAELLALGCGMPTDKVKAMRSHELTAFYSVARKSPEAARRMALKQRPQAQPNAPQPPQALPTPSNEQLEALQAALQADLARMADTVAADAQAALAGFTEALPGIVATEIARIVPRAVTVTIPDLPPVTVERAHTALERVLRKAVKRRDVYLVGDMGTGKTTLAEQIATILKLPFGMESRVFEEHKIFGYMFGKEYISTQFRKIFEHGGVFLFDEMDRSDPSVVVAFNAVTNGYCVFPDGAMVKRHPDCVLIAAGNTAMRGANREFNTAQKMDSSVLDRWQIIRLEIDLELEAAICINADWLAYCRALRAAAKSQAVADLSVSPRAAIQGAIAIAEGDTWLEAAESLIWKELSQAARERLEAAVPLSSYETSLI